MNWPKSQQLLAENSHLIPGGLASLNRKADPVIAFVRAKGSCLRDIDGHEYIDFPAVAKQGSISFAHSEADINQTLESTDSALLKIVGK